MRAIKSRGKKSTELKLIEIFKAEKIISWRRNYKLFGKPDFVFPKQRIAIFLDGCFWHGHDCRNTKPADNADYWLVKIERNKLRDESVTKKIDGQRLAGVADLGMQNKKECFTNGIGFFKMKIYK